MIYTLYNSSGEITGKVNLNDPAMLLPYLNGGVQAVEDDIDASAFKMDVTTAQAVAQVVTLDQKKDIARDELSAVVAPYRGADVVTPYGSFKTNDAALAALTSAAVAAMADPAYALDLVDGTGAVVTLNKVGIIAAQKAVVGYRAALAVARQNLLDAITGAVDDAALAAVDLSAIDTAMQNQQSAENQQGQIGYMASQQYIQGLAAAGIFYTPIATPRNAPLSKGFFRIGDDLEGVTLNAQVSTVPGDPGTLLTVNAEITETIDKTWLALVADGTLSYVPRGKVPEDTVKVNSIVISAPQADIEALPQTGSPGENTKLHWDLKAMDDPVRVISSGEFIIVEGVTA